MNRAVVLGVAASLAAGAWLSAQPAVPELAFDSVTDFLRTPADTYVGEVSGVGANSKGQIFVYTRTGHPYATLADNRTFFHGGSRLFQFDGAGKFVRELGQDVYGFNTAIGLRVDPQDNVWTIDAGANQVVKFDPEGRVALVLGRKPESIAVRPPMPRPESAAAPAVAPPAAAPGGGARRAGEGVPGSGFNRPSDVAWDAAGNIYVADGLGANNRVAKFDKDGRFIRHWGATGSAPGEFRGLKAIVLDAKGNVYVADAGNKRVQVFDGDGQFQREFAGVGTPLSMCITRGATQHLYIAHSGDPDGMEDAAIYKVALDGTVVGKFGSAGKQVKQFGLANSLDCRGENELLVGEVANWRVQRVTVKAR